LRAACLLYHDVIENGDWDSSGFVGPGTAKYKLSRAEVEAHQSRALDLDPPEQPLARVHIGQRAVAEDHIDQLKAGQQQMSREIAKPFESKASEQNLRPKTSAPPPRPITTPARKPVPKLSSPQDRARPLAPIPAPIRPVSYSSSVRFHHRPGTKVNTTRRHELEPRSITATCWLICCRRAAALVDQDVVIDSFADESLARPGLHDALRKVQIKIVAKSDPAYNMNPDKTPGLALIHLSEPPRLLSISYAGFCLGKEKITLKDTD